MPSKAYCLTDSKDLSEEEFKKHLEKAKEFRDDLVKIAKGVRNADSAVRYSNADHFFSRMSVVSLRSICSALSQEIRSLKSRLTEMEQRSRAFTYRGVWKEAETYDLGDFCTKDGGLWHCNTRTQGYKPGETDAWTLAVQRGRDGRDRR